MEQDGQGLEIYKKIPNSHMITVEIEDFLSIKDVVMKAINSFNSECLGGFKLINKADKYDVLLCKKSGKPDFDLPPLLLDISIKESKIQRMAILFQESHIFSNEELIQKTESFRATLMSKSNIDEENKRNNNKEPLLNKKSEKNKRCCEWLIKIFS